uniref:Alpha/beta hydrolase n=1 Tax=Bosea sp. NBC_00436 TaxID=2969620 RepID=A0A9E8A171_9HYPH
MNSPIQPRDGLISGGSGNSLSFSDNLAEGEAIVFVHGANRNSADWFAMASNLSSYRIVTFDLRGHGQSAVPTDNDYSLAAHSADIEMIVRTLGLPKPFLLGHSLGGLIAMRYAQHHQVSGIINLDGFDPTEPRLYKGIPADEVHALQQAQRAAMLDADGTTLLSPESASAMIDRAVETARVLGLPTEIIIQTLKRSLFMVEPDRFERRPRPEALAGVLRSLDEWDMFDFLAQPAAPTLFVHGQRRMPGVAGQQEPPWVRALAAGVDELMNVISSESYGPWVRGISLDDAGHMLHIEMPETVSNIVKSCIRLHEDARGRGRLSDGL